MGKTGDFSKKQLHLSLGSYFIGNLSSGIFNFTLSLYVLKVTDSSFSFSLLYGNKKRNTEIFSVPFYQLKLSSLFFSSGVSCSTSWRYAISE